MRAALDVRKPGKLAALLTASNPETVRDTVGYDASLVPEEKREIVALFQANDQIADPDHKRRRCLAARLPYGWEESGTRIPVWNALTELQPSPEARSMLVVRNAAP